MKYPEFLEYVKSRYTDDIEAKRAANVPAHSSLVHACMGLSGETGELIDLLKKHIFYGRPLDQEALLSELGDVLHYYMRIADLCHFSLPTIMEYHKVKLMARDATSHNHYFSSAGLSIKDLTSE
jgi:NTP pyrophosphatase (non-canonical NTP hydrolase)